MIEVVYYRKRRAITVKGHANSGDPGRDLVCASSSILVYTLAVNVENMAKSGMTKKPTIKISVGDAEIRCKPLPEYKSVVSMVFNSVCVGFELLAQYYPAYVKYTIR